MKGLWKQSGLACVDAGPLSPLGGGRSRRRARLTLLGFAAAFAAFTAYVAFASSPGAGGAPAAGAGGGGEASWFGGVYASTAPYRSQVSSFLSSIFPNNSSAPSPEPVSVSAGGSSRGAEVSRDASSVQVGSNSSASAGSGKQLGGAPISNASGSGVPPAADFAGTGIGGKDGSRALTNSSATSGSPTNDLVDRNKGNDGGVSSSQAAAGGGSGSPANSSTADGTTAKETVDVSNKQEESGSGTPSNADAGHGSTGKVEAKDAAGTPSNSSAGSGSSAKADLSTGSSSVKEGSGSAVPSSASAAKNSTPVKAGAEVAASEASNGSAGSGSDSKAGLTNDSDSQTGSGSGDASHKLAGSSSLTNSDARDGSVESNNSNVSMVPVSSQARSVALTGEKEARSPTKNDTLEASPALKNQEQTSGHAASDGSGGTADNQKGAAPHGDSGSAQTITSKSGDNNNVSGSSTKEVSGSSGDKKVDWFNEMASCDMFHGSWVRDDSYPLYPEGSCPHIDEPFDCYLNGRRDLAYQKLRWQPSGCNIPRLNPTDMLERLRGKRLVFVGDSLNRNMWESLVCILRNSIKDKRKVFEASGRHEFKTEGSYSFLFTDYNCSVEFFRSPFLVQEWEAQVDNGKKKETLRLDLVEQSSPRKDYYQEGSHIYSELNVEDAFHKALVTWSKWIDTNVNPRRTTVLFRGYSASHFSGGQWNSGGSCDKESEPITNEQYLSTYPPKMSILEDVIHKMKTPVVYLNVTRMTDYRKDAHPSIYRKQNLTDEERRSPERYQDCSHWCLPGVPDSWNELVYAQLLMKQHQMLQQ
ncbi:hypothetical protein PR202_ga17811 [Eleusine coracana subsp. coracana]|uniref:Trichome birefringence-like N-terminal domain-containing protein n=1 Tax=Eleusine coracana subsp. coracana TaxID=191504 RepID=A0AAV5CRA0_ELECO|nr:hypothetical protein PR202_ga17811 [Eleusine coracana subsp. coracana]